MTSEKMLDDWLHKARLAKHLTAQGELWPAWSMGELLAVSLILDDADMLRYLDYTRTEALERLRHEIEEPSIEAAARVFARLAKEAEGAARGVAAELGVTADDLARLQARPVEFEIRGEYIHTEKDW